MGAAVFWVRGMVGTAVRARMCFGWASAVATLARMTAEGISDAAIHPVGRLEVR